MSSDKRLRLAEFREGISEVYLSGVEKVLVLWIFFIEGQIFYEFSTSFCLLLKNPLRGRLFRFDTY